MGSLNTMTAAPTGKISSMSHRRQELTICAAPRLFSQARYWEVRLDTAAVNPTAVRDNSTEKAGITS